MKLPNDKASKVIAVITITLFILSSVLSGSIFNAFPILIAVPIILKFAHLWFEVIRYGPNAPASWNKEKRKELYQTVQENKEKNKGWENKWEHLSPDEQLERMKEIQRRGAEERMAEQERYYEYLAEESYLEELAEEETEEEIEE